MKKGLNAKIYVAGSYENLQTKIGYLSEYDCDLRQKLHPLFAINHFAPSCHKAIRWTDGLAPNYPKDEIEDMLKRRYENSRKPIEHTLPRLKKDPIFLEAVEKLKSEGWLDWQILMAIATLTLNYRINKKMAQEKGSYQKYQDEFMKQLHAKEDESAMHVPAEHFTYQNMRNAMITNLGSTFKSIGYELKRQTPNMNGMLEFARQRLRFFEDDIPHEEVFTQSDS